MMGSEKGANAALVGKTFSPIARIGTISEVTVILKASVSHNIPIKMSNAKPRFSIGVNGNSLMRAKNSRKSKANII